MILLSKVRGIELKKLRKQRTANIVFPQAGRDLAILASFF